jgi:hypothetical protein
MGWIDLARDRCQSMALMNMLMNLRVPYNVGEFLSSWATGSFSRRARLHGVRLVHRNPLCGSFVWR